MLGVSTMKIYNFFLFLFVGINGDPFIGEWTSKVQENIRTDYVPVRMHCQKLSYTKGGIIIKYPQDYFSSTPYVYISVELNKLKYSQDLHFSPIIRFSTAKGVMIFIHTYATGYFSSSVIEANSDDVFVNVFSFGR